MKRFSAAFLRFASPHLVLEPCCVVHECKVPLLVLQDPPDPLLEGVHGAGALDHVEDAIRDDKDIIDGPKMKQHLRRYDCKVLRVSILPPVNLLDRVVQRPRGQGPR